MEESDVGVFELCYGRIGSAWLEGREKRKEK
jgi:hypothetical protein